MLPIIFKLIYHKQISGMESKSLIFINATGTPGLSPRAAKQMRSHITRTNFAKRRQRICRNADPGASETRVQARTVDKQIMVPKRQNVVTETGFVAAMPLVTGPSEQYCYSQFRWYTPTPYDEMISKWIQCRDSGRLFS